jgi:small conductance mechanosensitive channel
MWIINTTQVALRSVLVGLSLASVPAAFAQDQEPPADPVPLTEELVMEFDEMRAAIEEQREDSMALEERREGAEGIVLNVLNARIESLWIALLDEGVRFAEAVIARREEGYTVDDIQPIAIEILQEHLIVAETAWAQVDQRSTLPSPDLGAADEAAAYRTFFDVAESTDRIISLIADSYATLDALGVPPSDAETTFPDRLRERAINISVYLDMSINDAAGLRAGLDALPGDTELSARLVIATTRITETANVLERVVRELDELGEDTSVFTQQLLTTTGEITTDTFDIQVIAGLLTGWGRSIVDSVVAEGPSFLVQILMFALIVFVALRAARLTGKLVERGLDKSNATTSQLLRRMIVSSAANLVIAIGVLIALSQVGISLGPLLAGLGIAGFVIGFALQDSLSNFASGLLILFYRPFDVGDLVEIGGAYGEVKQMSLVNTTILTLDNQRIILPNSMIWGGVIKNVTAQKVRRVDMMFGISYSDDIPKTERILKEVVKAHELTLDQPEPIIRLHELGDSSVNFAVRPWAKTDDYWDVYWDLMRAVKIRFDEEGISIPFPQRDVHLYTENETQNSMTEPQ